MIISCMFKKYPTCISVCGVSGPLLLLIVRSSVVTCWHQDHQDTGRGRSKAALGSGYILSSSDLLSPVFPTPFLSFSFPSLLSFSWQLSSFLCLLSWSKMASSGRPHWVIHSAPSLLPLFAFVCLFTVDCSPSSPPGYTLSASSRVQPFPCSCPPSPKAGISIPLWAPRFAVLFIPS